MNNQTIHDYLFDRREGFLQRWHSEYTTRKESLAEHQWFVTRNAMLICQALKNFQIEWPDTETCIRMAMFHDEAEILTGDVSGKAKRLWPIIKEAMNEAEDNVIEEMYKSLPENMQVYMWYPLARYRYFKEDDMEAQIVKYCDILDAHIFATTEHNLGNTYLDDAIERTTDWLKQMQWPWLQELREEINLP